MGISVLLIALLVVGPLVLIAGIDMLRRSLSPARRGTEPHCRKCEYLLVGLQSSRCPECGTELLEEAIAYGQRVRHPALGIVGGFTTLLGIVLLIPLLGIAWQSIPWIKIKPDFMLMRDAESPGHAIAMEAIGELRFRSDAGGLSKANQEKLIARALKEQGSTSTMQLTARWVDMVADLFVQNRLTESQKNQFMNQIVGATLVTRARIAPGDPTMLMITHVNRASSEWWVQETCVEVRIDGRLISEPGGSGASSGLGAGRRTGLSVGPLPPGRHEVAVVWRVEVFQQPQSDQSKLVFRRDQTLTGTLEVLDAEPADYIKAIDDPSLAAAMQASLTPVDFTLGIATRLSGRIQAKGIPADVSFEVYARAGETEYRMGSITGLAGSASSYSVSSSPIQPDPPVTKVDLVLRSSDKPVRNTVDQSRFWKGELIYRDVPVRIISPALQP